MHACCACACVWTRARVGVRVRDRVLACTPTPQQELPGVMVVWSWGCGSHAMVVRCRKEIVDRMAFLRTRCNVTQVEPRDREVNQIVDLSVNGGPEIC